MANLKDIAEKLAPKISEALQGPLQGQVMSIVLKRLKVKTIEEAEAKLSSDPTSVSQLKNAEQDYIDLVEKPSLKRKWREDMPLILITIIYNVGYFVLLYLFIKITFGAVLVVDGWIQGIVGTLIGVLTAQLPSINGYWFGSSAGSAQKTALIAEKIGKG